MNKEGAGECSGSVCNTSENVAARSLNQTCFCKTLDSERLYGVLRNDDVDDDLLSTHPQLFSNIATFIAHEDRALIRETVHAIERVVALPEYQHTVLAQSHNNAAFRPSAAGVFMGYDFHLGADRPKLIEINTNAGGAFLNAVLLSAQTACCPPMKGSFLLEKENLYRTFIEMFINEWRLQRGDQPLQRIAIVDQEPEKQFLYPEFKIAQQIFIESGIEAVITAPEQLLYKDGTLYCEGLSIDLVYNRLTDFSFVEKTTDSLNAAYQADAVVVTPNPYLHAIYADKRNLILLTDEDFLRQAGVSEDDISVLGASVPVTRHVTRENAEDLWLQRKDLFFKPTAGYGGKATYRGDKLTKRVWSEILQGRYIAQQQVLPSERGVILDGQASSLKMDIRAYTYRGEIQLLAARLYQGQTTNFRTSGGGFSPVFVI